MTQKNPNPSPSHCLRGIDVFIVAGGLGTRIAPILGETPKLLAPIGGYPYLAYLLRWLWRFEARRIVLGLGHRASVVIDYLNHASISRSDYVVETIVEPLPLGTAGAIRFARQSLHSDPVLIMNGDSFVDADLCQFVDYHGRNEAE